MIANASALDGPNSKPPGRMFMAIGFVAATLITTGLTSAANVIVSEYQTAKSQRVQAILAFEKSSLGFEGLVENYVTAVLDKGDIKQPANALVDSIQDQNAQLQAVERDLDESGRKQATVYRGMLVAVADGLQGATDPVTAMRIAQPAHDAVAARRELLTSLRREAGMAVGGDTQP